MGIGIFLFVGNWLKIPFPLVGTGSINTPLFNIGPNVVASDGDPNDSLTIGFTAAGFNCTKLFPTEERTDATSDIPVAAH